MDKVVVYSSHGCVHCIVLKQWLESKGIEFEERNVSDNKEHRKELIKRKVMTVPYTVINDSETVMGFDPQQISQILGLEEIN